PLPYTTLFRSDLGLGGGEDRRDCAVVHHAGQAVAAQKKQVVRLQAAVDHVEMQLAIGADRPRDPVGEGMAAGLLGRQLAALDQLLDIGVIAGQLFETPGAPPVQPAVAGPDHGEILLERQERDDRAAVQIAVFSAFDQRPIAAGQGLVDRLEQLARAARPAYPAKLAYDQVAGIVAAVVSAHAVGDGPDAQVGTGEAGVLVQGPDEPDMGAYGRLQARLEPGHGAASRQPCSTQAPSSSAANCRGGGSCQRNRVDGATRADPAVQNRAWGGA